MIQGLHEKSLTGRVAVVTGSFSGIGLSIAHRLASAGATPVLHGLADDDTVRKIQADFKSRYGTDCMADRCDLRIPSEIEAFCRRIMDTYGGADILVNNAGIQYIAPVQDFPPEKWQEIIAVNLSAAFMMTHYLLPAMQAKQWGRVVNIASVHGLVASVNKSAYVSAKHGLIGFTKAAALENAASGITVNAVCPGWVETELIKHQYKTLAEKRSISVEDGKQELIREKQPNLRFISPDQLADIVLFMCSDSAAGITGSSYTVDGGWTAQ